MVMGIPLKKGLAWHYTGAQHAQCGRVSGAEYNSSSVKNDDPVYNNDSDRTTKMCCSNNRMHENQIQDQKYAVGMVSTVLHGQMGRCV